MVGHGMVGHRLVEAVRARDADGSLRITVLAEEGDAAYDRVGLTSYTESWDRALLALPGNDYAGDQRVRLLLNTRVTQIDRATKSVVTAAGQRHRYDTLVLATGSYAFVPPVPGHDLPACHVYRTFDDLDAIRAGAQRTLDGGHTDGGVVIGGGLLGLEAANALRQFGLQTHVVEMMPRLMAQQIDEAGGALLARMIADLGIAVHVGTGTESIESVKHSDGSVWARVRLSDGEVIDAGVVIFAAGIRPRDELARAAGLAIGDRGGVLTDLSCRTSDPDIYAVGEVAAIDGRCYGLVGPGYTSAEVVADRLLDGSAEFPEADLSTKLKLLGVDVASFGDAMGATENCLEVVINDAVKRTYAKLVLSDDATTLLGGVLVGDASSYGVLRPMVGAELPGDPLALIAPAGSGAGAGALGVGALPDSAQICSCNNVTKGELKCAIADGCGDVPALKSCTAAGTSCGSCVPLLKQLLEAEGVEQSKALCEHFSQSRAELFEIITATEVRTFSGLLDRFGRGKGCDICKPVVASILASTGSDHILDGEQASLQDSNDHFLANIQKNGSYSVVPRVPGGDIKPEHLILIGQIAQDFGLYTKITGGQRIDLFGARVDQLPLIWQRLVPLRSAGFGAAGHRPGTALSRATGTAQDKAGRLGLRAGMRRGARQGCGRDRHRERLEPLRRRQRRHDAQARSTTGQRPRQRDAHPLHRPLSHLLHPHGRPAAANRAMGGIAWAGPCARGGLRGLAGSGRGIRGRDATPCRQLQVRVEGRAGGPGQAVPVRFLRQRPRCRRLDGDLHRACRAQSTCVHWYPAGPIMKSGRTKEGL